MTPNKPTTWLVEKFENGSAVLKNSEATIRVARNLLVEGVQKGDIVTAEFYPLKDAKKRQEDLARAILEEIIGTE